MPNAAAVPSPDKPGGVATAASAAAPAGRPDRLELAKAEAPVGGQGGAAKIAIGVKTPAPWQDADVDPSSPTGFREARGVYVRAGVPAPGGGAGPTTMGDAGGEARGGGGAGGAGPDRSVKVPERPPRAEAPVGGAGGEAKLGIGARTPAPWQDADVDPSSPTGFRERKHRAEVRNCLLFRFCWG